MGLAKKTIQVFFLVLLSILFSSCEDRCYDPQSLDSFPVSVKSNPGSTKITGSYDSVTGGQHIQWQDTDLKTTGEEFIIRIYGSWTPWNGSGGTMSDSILDTLDPCDMCAMKRDGSTPNCMCLLDGLGGNQSSPITEKNVDVGVDCTVGDVTEENDPDICSCTNQHDNPFAYLDESINSISDAVYFFPLNYYNKDKTVKVPDNQSVCKFDNGMGAYIGLFGAKGVSNPTRVYHLYTQEKDCEIDKPAGDECVDDDGNYRGYYVFRSSNDIIFKKDDNQGNDGNDTSGIGDELHEAEEIIKLKMYDRYYSDNYGEYNIDIIKGAYDASGGTNRGQAGILEFMVRLVEDVLLGESDGEGGRDGGVLKFLFKSIVQDSGFMLLVQVSLSLYISIFGVAVLFGVADITKKELMSRVLKIGLVVFFTTSSSWELYNSVIVGFFYNSMNALTGMILSLSSQALDISTTSEVLLSQLAAADNVGSYSSSARFTYIDNTFAMLLSKAAAAKIFGLFFTNGSILFIGVIYFLIGYFILTMLTAASVYAINIMKIIFALSLGPIFICFTLFGQTNQMFKNWLAFLSARSLEILMMFLILFSFVSLININFTSLLYYKVCVEDFSLEIFTVKVLKAYVSHRGFMDWIMLFLNIGALTYLTGEILSKIPNLAEKLISIGGVRNSGSSSSFKAAVAMTGGSDRAKNIAGAFAKGLEGGAYVTGGAIRAGNFITRKTGIAKQLGRLTSAIPFNNPRKMARHSVADTLIKAAKKKAEADHAHLKIKGDGSFEKAVDKDTRKAAAEEGLKRTQNKHKFLAPQASPIKSYLIGLDAKTMQERLDKALITDRLKDAMKTEAKRVRSLAGKEGAIAPGKETRNHLNEFAKNWADNNLYVGAKDVKEALDNKKGAEQTSLKRSLEGLAKKESKESSSQAAKAYAHDKEGKEGHLKYLQDKADRSKAKDKEAGYGPTGMLRKAKNVAAYVTQSDSSPAAARKNFLRKVANEERGFYKMDTLNPANYMNSLKSLTSSSFAKKDLDAKIIQKSEISDSFKEGFKKELDRNIDSKRKKGGELGAIDAYSAELEKIDSKELTSENILEVKATTQIVATALDAEPVSSSDEALLKDLDAEPVVSSDEALDGDKPKSGSPFLGQSDPDDKDLSAKDLSTKNALTTQKAMTSTQLRMGKMELKIQEFELSQLKSGDGDEKQIRELEGKIETSKENVKNLELKDNRVRDQLNDFSGV